MTNLMIGTYLHQFDHFEETIPTALGAYPDESWLDPTCV